MSLKKSDGAKDGAKKSDAENQKSLGYPLIENLLEKEDFDQINKSFGESYQKLHKIFMDPTSGLKKQKEARKIMEAYESTTDLIRELLKLKYQVLEQQKKAK